MMILRLIRIAAIALGFACLFALSRYLTAIRGGEDLPGVSWALAVVSTVFTGSAAVCERIRGPESNLHKDVLWGLAAGGIISVISRF